MNPIKYNDVNRVFNEVFVKRLNLNTDKTQGKYYILERKNAHGQACRLMSIDPTNHYAEDHPWGYKYVNPETMYDLMWFALDTLTLLNPDE